MMNSLMDQIVRDRKSKDVIQQLDTSEIVDIIHALEDENETLTAERDEAVEQLRIMMNDERSAVKSRDSLRGLLVKCQTYFDLSGCDRQLYESIDRVINHKEVQDEQHMS